MDPSIVITYLAVIAALAIGAIGWAIWRLIALFQSREEVMLLFNDTRGWK